MNGVVRITLNRPEKRNALDRPTILSIQDQLHQAGQNPEARVILLRAEGKDFCSGADLGELRRIRDASSLENLQDARILGELFIAMRRHPLPIVAAVQGRALAGGCGLATAADIILASETARFGYPEVNIGFVPAMVMAILRRSVSEKRAFEWLTTGKILTAQEAFEAGWINAVHSAETLSAAAEAYVVEMASRSPSAVQLTKRLLYQMDGIAFDASIESGAQINAIARMTEDCRNGIDRFLKKE